MSAIRSAIGAALDHPFAEEAFALVDRIESEVESLDFDGDPDHHETAAEIADSIVDSYSAREVATLWVVLQADNLGAERGLYGGGAVSTSERVRLDLYRAIESGVHAALVAATTQEG